MLFTRPDGKLARDVPPFREMMPFLMPTRNESAVYFEQQIDLRKTLPFITKWNDTSIKYSFDERIEDGLYCARGLEIVRQRLEDPTELEGAVAPAEP